MLDVCTNDINYMYIVHSSIIQFKFTYLNVIVIFLKYIYQITLNYNINIFLCRSMVKLLLVLFAGIPCFLAEERQLTKAQGEDGRASSIAVYNIEG